VSKENKAKNLAKQLRNVGPKLAEKLIEARIDTPQEVEYYRHGGILHYVLRQLAAS
jgi:aconitate hydratase